jgi:acylphosphatase
MLVAGVWAYLAAGAPAAPSDPNAIIVDKKARTVSIPARVAQQGTQSALKGMVEYLLVSRGGKTYETVFVTYRRPDEIRDALEQIGLRTGKPADGKSLPGGSPVLIFAEYESGGKKVRRAADEFLIAASGGKPIKACPWVYTGSIETVSPSSGKKMMQASLTRSVVGLHSADGSPLLQNTRPESLKDNFYKANAKALPPSGTPVRLIFQRTALKTPKGARRVCVMLTGRVQGVGFRAFAQRQARVRGLVGFVRALDGGRVELVVEGTAAGIAELLKKVRRGPRAARVEKVEITEERPEGSFKGFEIWL